MNGLSTGSPLLNTGTLKSLSAEVKLSAIKGSGTDSGFSSRMSEADAETDERAAKLSHQNEGLLGEDHVRGVLRKRLNRISECQYGA